MKKSFVIIICALLLALPAMAQNCGNPSDYPQKVSQKWFDQGKMEAIASDAFREAKLLARFDETKITPDLWCKILLGGAKETLRGDFVLLKETPDGWKTETCKGCTVNASVTDLGGIWPLGKTVKLPVYQLGTMKLIASFIPVMEEEFEEDEIVIIGDEDEYFEEEEDGSRGKSSSGGGDVTVNIYNTNSPAPLYERTNYEYIYQPMMVPMAPITGGWWDPWWGGYGGGFGFGVGFSLWGGFNTWGWGGRGFHPGGWWGMPYYTIGAPYYDPFTGRINQMNLGGNWGGRGGFFHPGPRGPWVGTPPIGGPFFPQGGGGFRRSGNLPMFKSGGEQPAVARGGGEMPSQAAGTVQHRSANPASAGRGNVDSAPRGSAQQAMTKNSGGNITFHHSTGQRSSSPRSSAPQNPQLANGGRTAGGVSSGRTAQSGQQASGRSGSVGASPNHQPRGGNVAAGNPAAPQRGAAQQQQSRMSGQPVQPNPPMGRAGQGTSQQHQQPTRGYNPQRGGTPNMGGGYNRGAAPQQSRAMPNMGGGGGGRSSPSSRGGQLGR